MTDAQEKLEHYGKVLKDIKAREYPPHMYMEKVRWVRIITAKIEKIKELIDV